MEYDMVDISDMQCWIFRLAQKKWHMPHSECAALFKKYNIMGFIEECYDTLHLNGYQAALDDVEMILRNSGVIL